MVGSGDWKHTFFGQTIRKTECPECKASTHWKCSHLPLRERVILMWMGQTFKIIDDFHVCHLCEIWWKRIWFYIGQRKDIGLKANKNSLTCSDVEIHCMSLNRKNIWNELSFMYYLWILSMCFSGRLKNLFHWLPLQSLRSYACWPQFTLI